MLAGLADGAMQVAAPTHLLAIAALGLMAGQGRRTVAATLLWFALGLLGGSLVIASAARDMPSALMLLGTAACAGLMAAAGFALPSIAKGILALATGGALALNAPPQAIGIAAAVASQVGTAAAAIAALALIMVTAIHADHPWQRIGVRIVGSWIAASAILVLALRLAR